MKGMAVCNVCERDFPLIFKEHKVVRDLGKKANFAGAFTSQDEEVLWDAFDCPYCGCQYIAQERKRPYCDTEEFCEEEEEK